MYKINICLFCFVYSTQEHQENLRYPVLKVNTSDEFLENKTHQINPQDLSRSEKNSLNVVQKYANSSESNFGMLNFFTADDSVSSETSKTKPCKLRSKKLARNLSDSIERPEDNEMCELDSQEEPIDLTNHPQPLRIESKSNYFSVQQSFVSEQFFEIICLEEDNSQVTSTIESESNTNNIKLTDEQNKYCSRDLIQSNTPVTEPKNENFNSYTLQQPPTVNSYLDKFKDVIIELESQFNEFIKNKVGFECKIEDILYCEELKTFRNFSKTFITSFDYTNNDSLENFSQSANLLYEFIGKLDLSPSGKIITKLCCIFREEVEYSEKIFFISESYILRRIYTLFNSFLLNDESNVFNKFASEFESFIYYPIKICPDSFDLHIRAFLINLISIKRISIIAQTINNKLSTKNSAEKIILFEREIFNTTTFTYTFIKFYSQAIHEPNLEDNMKFYILITSMQIESQKFCLENISSIENMCKFMPYVLFDLVSLKIKIFLMPNNSNNVTTVDWFKVIKTKQSLSCIDLEIFIFNLYNLILSRKKT